MEKLDSRLAAAADFVGYGTVAADIGTDHGYLVCWLVENGVCKRAYATDINEKPLESAKALIAEKGLGDKIETRLTNGLNGLPSEEINEVLICGMGGETIMGILASHKWVKSERVHLVLQPCPERTHCAAGSVKTAGALPKKGRSKPRDIFIRL